MNRYAIAARPYIQQMVDQFMLWVCLITPIVFIGINHLLIPEANSWLSAYFNQPDLLLPYYETIDAFVGAITATMVGYTGVLVVLDELDTGSARYFCITPLGKQGYVFTRIGIPVLPAGVLILVVLGLGNLSGLSWQHLWLITISSGIIGLAIALLVLAFAHNRIEGIALTKIGNVALIAIPVGALVSGFGAIPVMWMPTYWLGRFTVTSNLLDWVLSLITGIALVVMFTRRFTQQLT